MGPHRLQKLEEADKKGKIRYISAMSKLYIVGTPIGNLGDITLRALETLKSVDFIIAEDTRVTKHLLVHFQINKPVVACFAHTTSGKMDQIIQRIANGETAALVSDAGTPGISDPGGLFVQELLQAVPEVAIIPIPGPSAMAAALSIAGLPADKFIFFGFPPHKKGRQTFWKEVVASECTVVFYESTHRIVKAMEELHALLGTDSTRRLVVCRELTKLYESVYRGTIAEVMAQVKSAPQKGEYVIVIEGCR